MQYVMSLKIKCYSMVSSTFMGGPISKFDLVRLYYIAVSINKMIYPYQNGCIQTNHNACGFVEILNCMNRYAHMHHIHTHTTHAHAHTGTHTICTYIQTHLSYAYHPNCAGNEKKNSEGKQSSLIFQKGVGQSMQCYDKIPKQNPEKKNSKKGEKMIRQISNSITWPLYTIFQKNIRYYCV